MRQLPAIYSAGLAGIILAPLIRSGHLLLRDAVSTPRSYLTDTALGLGDAAPRAVPQDALVAALSTVVDGGVVVTALTVAAVWLAGWGAAVLVRELLGVAVAPQLVAATVAIWNPYVAERLLQGHWSLLVGYAALPWVYLYAHTRRWAALVACLAAAAFTPTGGILAVIVAIVAVGRGAGARWAVAGLGLLTWTPWLVATALGAGAEPSDPAGVSAFAARAEPGLGTLGSLAGLGGIWNSHAVPPSRTCLIALPATIVLVALVAVGLPALWRSGYRGVILLAGGVILVPALAATPPGIVSGQWLVAHFPGAGLLRDTQKYTALAVPCYVLSAAGYRGMARRSSAVVAMLLLLITLPDLAFGVGGRIRSVHYPAAWERLASALHDVRGDIAVLPTGMFRIFPFSGPAPVLDPAPRILPADVLQTGDLPVDGGVVAGEGVRARQAADVLLRGDPPERLAALGVGAVVVERTTPGPMGAAARTLAQLEPVPVGHDLALYLVSKPTLVTTSAGDRRAAIAAHLFWATLLCFGTIAAIVSSRRDRKLARRGW